MEEYRKYEPFFGSWYLSRLIGKGSFGKVFEITREEFGTTYRAALKIITVPQDEEDIKSLMSGGSDLASISDYYATVLREIINENEIMAQLKGNSNIVSYEDHMIIPHDDGIGYDILIRMELLTPLLDRLIESSLDESEAVRLGIDICKALEICHRKNIIHRDIKPQNIFISDNGDFKLGDFGIARTMEKTTGGMSRKGTYKYMAPEVFRGERYDETADIYSLGIVLYSLLNGNRAPFLPAPPAKVTLSDEEDARVRRLRGERLPAPKYASSRLAQIILKACEADPSKRYSSASQMRRDLEAYRQNSDRAIYDFADEETVADPVAAADEATMTEVRDVPSPDRKKPLIFIAALVALAFIAVGIFLVMRHGAESKPAAETEAATEVDTESVEEAEAETGAAAQYPEGAVEFGGSYYKLMDDHLTWAEARAACEEAGGHLVTITSAEEQSFISDIIEEHLAGQATDVHHYWLGGTDEESESRWKWITGEAWDYSNWGDNQPNDGVNDINKEGQDYLEIQLTRGDQGSGEYLRWNDINNAGTSNVKGVSHEEAPDYCSTKYFGYICEWDGNS